MKRYTPYVVIVALIAWLVFLLMNPKIVEKKVEVPVEKIKKVEVTKEVEVKNLWIVSEPSNANVIIDDEIVGQTPYKVRWENRAFSFSLSKNKFKTVSKTVSNYEESIQITLNAKGLNTSIVTNPSGIEVWNGDTNLGKTPIEKVWFAKGNQTLHFKNENGIDVQKTIAIQKEGQLIYEEFEQKLVPVKVVSNIENARVYLNGKLVGLTPYIDDVNSGKYDLKVEYTGYEMFEEEVVFEIENGFNRELTLEKSSADLVVNSENASIFINGKEMGKNAYQGQYDEGKYVVKATKNGFQDVEKEFNLNAGKQHFLYLNPFEKIEEPEKTFIASNNPWTKHRRIGLVSSLALVGGAVFFNDQMSSAQSDYDDAITNNNASSFRDDIERNETFRNTSYYISIGTIGWTAYSWFKEAQWEKNHRKGANQ